MTRIERKLLVYIGKLEYNHIDDIVNRFSFDPLDDLVNALNSIEGKKWVQRVDFDGTEYYQRTVTGRMALTGEKPYSDSDDIPF